MIKVKKLFISLLPIGYGGAGDYLHEINKDFKNYKRIITPNLFPNNKIINKLSIIFISISLKLFLKFILYFIKIEKIAIFHQQSIGYDLTSRLLAKSSNIIFFILDTNFFCKKSYNEYQDKVCNNCFDKFKPYNDCYHHPYISTDKEYQGFLYSLKQNQKKITFITQTDGYSNIVKKKFPYSNIENKKMHHEKLKKIKFISHLDFEYEYDFFYHAHLTPPKGINYFIQLSITLDKKNFFLPSHLRYLNLKKNMIIKKMYWGNEFIEKMKKSRIILCPSIWTYPVESAVLKSLLLKKAVAIIKSPNSFSENIPDDAIIKLSGNIQTDRDILLDIINNKKYETYAKNGHYWVNKYLGY